MGRDIQAWLAKKRGLVADGAWGTELIARGFEPEDCLEHWNHGQPEIVAGLGRAYVKAGADVLYTNTFGANRLRLARYRLDAQAAALNEAGAQLSRGAAGPTRYVAGAMGPAADPGQRVSAAECYDAYAEQAHALAAGGVDACVAETMTEIETARAALRAIREAGRREAWCTFAFTDTPPDYPTPSGLPLREAVAAALDGGAVVVGANCMVTAPAMVPIIAAIREAAPNTPIAALPNAGQPIEWGGRIIHPATPEANAGAVSDLLGAGARILGGCCGCGPAHIAALRSAVDAWLKSRP